MTDSDASLALAVLCSRIEMMCRYGPLDDDEVTEVTMKDREAVESMYGLFRHKGHNETQSSRMSRASAILLLLQHVLGVGQ